MKKTTKTTAKTRSYARTIASNFWVLWQPPIGNVTPYFRGLAPYGDMHGGWEGWMEGWMDGGMTSSNRNCSYNGQMLDSEY